jgi:hypothetical protein
MSVPALFAHKEAFLRSMEVVSTRVESALALQPGRGFQLLTRTHAMTRGLWQSFGDPVLELPGHHHQHVFAVELREALLEYWRGALLGLAQK